MNIVFKEESKIAFKKVEMNTTGEYNWEATLKHNFVEICTYGKTKVQAADDIVRTLRRDGFNVDLEL